MSYGNFRYLCCLKKYLKAFKMAVGAIKESNALNESLWYMNDANVWKKKSQKLECASVAFFRDGMKLVDFLNLIVNILDARNHNSGKLETDLILLRWHKLVLASFVKLLPRKRCEASFTYGDNASRIPEAKLCRVKCGFLWPDRRGNTRRNIQLFVE